MTLFFLPFFLALGIYILFQIPQPDMPPSLYATLPAGQANQLEEEMEVRNTMAHAAKMELEQHKKQREEVRKRAEERRKEMHDVKSPKEMHRYVNEIKLDGELDREKTMNLAYKKMFAQAQLENVRLKQIKIYSKANKDWQKGLAEATVKRASSTLAFVVACLLPALIFVLVGRGNSVWPVLRGFVLAAPVVSLLALLPWLPLEHPFFDHPLLAKTIAALLPPLANLHTFLITGYWTW